MKTLLRIIESTLPYALRDTLDAHAAAARVDGWNVIDAFASRRDDKNPRGVVDIAENIIWPAIAAHENLHVFAIGDLPIPRSGFALNPDGHPENNGAYPCPTYWASGSQVGWTDTLNNTGFPSKPVFEHAAGDCVWDQDILPASARCAIGILNLTPAAKNKAWGFAGPTSTWVIQAYRRYFDSLLAWKTSAIRPVAPFAHGHGLTPTGDQRWLLNTDPAQTVFRNATQPRAFDGPYGYFYDVKGLPTNGDFWFKRRTPVAAVYLEFESYQTDWTSSRLQNALLTGSAAAAPVGFEWNVADWREKTVGELWMQSARQGRRPWISLYGDPTFKLNVL